MTGTMPKDRFLESLDRCKASESFLACFYDRLLDADPEIRLRFRFTNMERQQAMLEGALRVCSSAVAGEPDGLAQLRELGRTHDRDHHDISPEWYPVWINSIVATAAEYDPEWSEEIESIWRSILQHVTHRMASQYNGQVAAL